MKTPNQFTTKLLMLLLLVAFASCEKDFDEALKDNIVTINETSRFHVRTGEDVSQKAVSFLKERTNNTLKVSLGKKSVMPSRFQDAARESAMGIVDTSKEIAVDNEYNTKHTFNIIDDGDPNTVINVIVVETADVTYEYFKKYTFQNGLPLNSDKTINLNLFKGVIETYNSAGELTGALLVIDGEVVDSGGNNDPCPDDDGIWDGWDDFWEQLNNGTSSNGNGGANTGDGANTSTGNTQGGEYVDPVDEEGCTVYEVNITCEICQSDLVGETHFTSGEHINDSDFLVVRCGNYVVTTAQRNGKYASRDAADEDPCGEGDTGILIDFETFIENCVELNKLLQTPTYPIQQPAESAVMAIHNLENELDESGEKGYSLRHNSSLNAYASPTNNNSYNKVRYPNFPNVFGGIHTHPDNNKIIPIFSPDDIRSLLAFSQNYNNGNTDDKSLFVHILVGSTGNYAIKIDDIIKLQQIANIFLDDKDANGDGADELRLLYRRYDNLFDKYYNEMTSQFIGSDTDFQKAFLQFITEKYDFGISLYEANDDMTNWNKLTLNHSSNIPSVDSIPCN